MSGVRSLAEIAASRLVDVDDRLGTSPIPCVDCGTRSKASWELDTDGQFTDENGCRRRICLACWQMEALGVREGEQ